MYTQEQDIEYIRGALENLRWKAKRDGRRTAALLVAMLTYYFQTYLSSGSLIVDDLGDLEDFQS